MLANLGLAVFTAAVLAASTADAGSSSTKFDLATSFGTKTVYWDQSKDPLGNKVKHFVTELDKDEERKYTLVQVQQVVRHGTRFPTEGNIEEITDLVAKLQANYSSFLPKWLQTYAVPYNVSIEGVLAPTGAAELEAFGKRTRASVKSLLPGSFSSDKFILQHTYKSRTKDSAYAFAKTFFRNPQNVTYIEYAKKDDPLLRFYDQCPRYVRDVEENPTAFAQMAAYKASPAFQKNIETLRKALNLPATAELTELDVESAFSACAFDLALYQTTRNWCTLLTPEFIKSVEFADDLETFYEGSHGNKISYEISAVLLQDVFKFMKQFTEGKTQVVGNFRFAHGETTLPLMTLLGYVNPTPLLATSNAATRKFRASRTAPFMANLEFRLYKKNKGGDDDDNDDNDDKKGKKDKFFVQIRINEQVTTVPGCDDEVFCELAAVEQIWDYYLTKYNYEADCKI